MAWNVDQIYAYLKYQLRKNQAGGISATDFFYSWNTEQAAYMQDMLGRFQKNSFTKEGINTGLIENQTIKTKLAPFTKNVSISVVAGLAPKPPDFTYAWAIRDTASQERVWPINPDQIYYVTVEDVIDPPSLTAFNFYCAEYGTNYKVFPSGMTSIDLDYCSSAPDIVWGFTLDVNNRQVYNSATSTQPLWSQSSIVEITRRAFKNLGVSFHDQEFTAFGQSTIQSGD